MSNGSISGLTVLAGGITRGLLGLRSSHVCQLPRALNFATARSFVEPTVENKAALQDLLTRMQIPSAHNQLLITGHTDSPGDRELNQRLSERRTAAVQAVLQGDPTGTAQWETLFNAEGWDTPELTLMVGEVGETDENRFRGPGARTARLDLYRRYFVKLLGGVPVPSFLTTSPPLLACGEDQLLHGDPSSPSRDTSLPPIEGDFRPNRRSEFFFFDATPSPIASSEYPTWTGLCSLAPPAPTVTVAIAPVDTVRKGQTVNVQVTVNPSPLPFGTQLNLTLSTISGTGEARFAGNNAATLTISQSGVVDIRGVTESSALDNIRLSATILGQTTVLAQEDFTVQDSISIFLRFEVWDTTTLAFVPLPAGVNVDIVHFRPVISNITLATAQTDAQGQVFFNQASFIQAQPSIFFHVQTNSRAHAHTTLPPEWSTKGWKSADNNPGFLPNYDGAPIGTPPSSPRVFRVGLDFHARFTYLNPLPSPHDDPATNGIPVHAQSGPIGIPPKATVQTDTRGEVHGLLFNVSPGDDFSFSMDFELTDSSINLPRARVNDPSGWNTANRDPDGKIFANNDRTSIGTQTSPELFRASVEERAHSLFMLKMLREWSTFWFHITGGAWTGVQELLLFNTVIPPATASFSFPVGQVHIHPTQHFEPDTLAHELTHQVMWKEADFGSLAIAYEGTAGNLILFHEENLFSNGEHALIEGWAETIEAVFARLGTPPYSVSTVRDSSGNRSPLGPPPPGKGESVEGAFANAMWAIFQNEVVTLPTNAHVPDTPNGDIMSTPAAAYLRNTAVRDRFLSMIFRPLQDLKTVHRPTTADMIARTKSRNSAEWFRILPEFQAFNLAMTLPTTTAISPSGGPPAGGTSVTVTGTDFTITNTSVTIGGAPATAVAVSSDTSLTAITPPGTLGRADVVVTTRPGASAPLTGGFLYAPTPVVTNVVVTGDPPGTPARGPTTGSTHVTITGTDFLPGAAVFFGGLPPAGVAAANVVAISSTQITADSPVFALPAHLPGLVDVVVRNPDGQSGTAAGSFEYLQVARPVIISVDPFPPSLVAAGPRSGGTPLIVTGSNFLAGVIVDIGGVAANIDASTFTSTRIDLVTPPAASPTATDVDVRVVNPDGQADVVPRAFTYTP